MLDATRRVCLSYVAMVSKEFDMQRRSSIFAGTPAFGAAFFLVGVFSLIEGGFLAAGAFLCIGLALILPGTDAQAWPTLPQWRRSATILALFVGAGCAVGVLITSLR